MSWSVSSKLDQSKDALVSQGDFVSVHPHRVMTHDNTAAVISKFRSIGAPKFYDPKQAIFALDHDVQNTSAVNMKKYAAIQAFAELHGVDFYPAGRGIGHQIVIEEGYAKPYSMVVASDSHSNMYGGIGCLGTPIVRTDAAAIWATGQTWWQIPMVVKVELQGCPPPFTTGKDIIVALCGLFNNDEVLNCAIEFVGDGISHLSIDDRLTISNMTTEWGALAGVFPVDALTIQWIRAQIKRQIRLKKKIQLTMEDIDDIESNPIKADEDAFYSKHLILNLNSLSECVSGPNSVKTVCSLVDLEQKKIKVNKAYLVSCVNSRLSDISSAAHVLRNRKVASGVELYISAASSEVQMDAESSGDWQVLMSAGATPLPAGCGPCIGLGVGLLQKGEVGISSTNRNYKGRMGSIDADTYLASPAVVAASAVAGHICGPRSLELLGDSVQSIVKSKASTSPIASTSCVTLKEQTKDKGSNTYRMEPGFENLVKGFPSNIKGELVFCDADNLSTDAIYPGKYTYNENMDPASMAQVVMENYDQHFAKAIIKGDVLVSGYNFGTGSSREQAATALVYAGIQVVLVGSVSETFKRNAINNGLIVLKCQEMVEDLRKARFVGGTRTLRTGLLVDIDLAKGDVQVTTSEQKAIHGWSEKRIYSVCRVGRIAQEIFVLGGLEEWVKHLNDSYSGKLRISPWLLMQPHSVNTDAGETSPAQVTGAASTITAATTQSDFEKLMAMVSHVPFAADTPTTDLCRLMPLLVSSSHNHPPSLPQTPSLHLPSMHMPPLQMEFDTVAPFLQSIQLGAIKWRDAEQTMSLASATTSTYIATPAEGHPPSEIAHTIPRSTVTGPSVASIMQSSAIAAEPPAPSDPTLSFCMRLNERDGLSYSGDAPHIKDIDCDEMISTWLDNTNDFISPEKQPPPQHNIGDLKMTATSSIAESVSESIPESAVDTGFSSKIGSDDAFLYKEHVNASLRVHPAPDTILPRSDYKRLKIDPLPVVPNIEAPRPLYIPVQNITDVPIQHMPFTDLTTPVVLLSQGTSSYLSSPLCSVTIPITKDQDTLQTLNNPKEYLCSKKQAQVPLINVLAQPPRIPQTPVELAAELICTAIHDAQDVGTESCFTDTKARCSGNIQYSKISRHLSKVLPDGLPSLLIQLSAGADSTEGEIIIGKFVDIAQNRIQCLSRCSLFSSNISLENTPNDMPLYEHLESNSVFPWSSALAEFEDESVLEASVVTFLHRTHESLDAVNIILGLFSSELNQGNSQTLISAAPITNIRSKYCCEERLRLCLELVKNQLTFTIVQSVALVASFEDQPSDNKSRQKAIFSKYPSHRQFILEEIMTSFSKICITGKKNHRIFRLMDGRSINIVSALLLLLLQNCGSMLDMLSPSSSYVLGAEISHEGASLLTKKTDGELPAHESDMVLKATAQSKDVIASSSSSVAFIITYLLSRCVLSSEEKDITKMDARRRASSLETEYCTVLDILLRDVLSLVGSPEWPVAETVAQRVTSIMVHLFDESFKSSDSSTIRSIALDWLGNIGSMIIGYISQWSAFQASSGLLAIPSSTPQIDDIKRLCEQQRVLLKWQFASFCQDSLSLKGMIGYTVSKWVSAVISASGSPQISSAIESSSLNDFVQNMIVTHSSELSMMKTLRAVSTSSVSRLDAERVSKNLMITNSLFAFRDTIVHCICGSLALDSVVLRTRSLKALHSILNVDSSLLLSVNIRHAIADRLMDSSANVRDAAIDLLGNYVLAAGKEALQLYYPVLCDRIMDVSPNVRKRILRLFKEIYQSIVTSSDTLSADQHSTIVDIASRILGRIHDEPGVSDLAIKILREFWLQTAKDRDYSTLLDWQLLSDQEKREFGQHSTILTQIVSKSSLLSSLLGEFFKATVKNVGSKQAMLQLRSQANCMVLCLMDTLLSLYEESKLSKQPSELQRDLQITHSVLAIFLNVLPMIQNPDRVLVENIETDLLQLLNKSPQSIIQSAIPCICMIVSKHTNNFIKLARIVSTCFSLLEKSKTQFLETKMLNASSLRTIWRCMILLTQVLRYYDFSSHRAASSYTIPEIETFAKGSLVICAAYDIIVFFLVQVNATDTNLVALSCIGSLFLAQPTLLINDQTNLIFKRVFVGHDVKEKRQLLSILNEYLEQEKKTKAEAQILSVSDSLDSRQGNAASLPTEKIDMKVLVGSAEEFAEAGVPSSVSQRYLKDIIDCILCGDVQLLSPAFQVLILIIEQGFVHPILAVPCIAAVASSDDSVLSSKALSIHQKLIDKHASFIHSKNIDAVRSIFDFHSIQISKVCDYTCGYVTSLVQSEAGVASQVVARVRHLYSLVRPVRAKRNDFLRALVRAFEGSKNTISLETIKYHLFIAENLVHLDYKTQDEVLLVIHGITRILSINGESTIIIVRKLIDDSTEFPESDLEILTYRALDVGILTLIKHQLQLRYNLTELRCSTFVPSASAFKALDKPLTMNPSMANLPIDWNQMLLTKPILGIAWSGTAEYISQCTKIETLVSELGNGSSDSSRNNHTNGQEQSQRHEGSKAPRFDAGCDSTATTNSAVTVLICKSSNTKQVGETHLTSPPSADHATKDTHRKHKFTDHLSHVPVTPRSEMSMSTASTIDGDAPHSNDGRPLAAARLAVSMNDMDDLTSQDRKIKNSNKSRRHTVGGVLPISAPLHQAHVELKQYKPRSTCAGTSETSFKPYKSHVRVSAIENGGQICPGVVGIGGDNNIPAKQSKARKRRRATGGDQ
ncbi:homoaconitase [Batrachochytrium salamandrivorans]|nr:homoaconitase [Batrachochytrium salamandrivorans]